MLSGFAEIAGLTTDPEEAMEFADVVCSAGSTSICAADNF